MVHFCKYAPHRFPGIQSFENFYQCMHDGRSLPLKIQHPDNPPLFAWIEHEYYLLTGDSSRLSRIVRDKRYLQKHFQFIENSRPETLLPYANCRVTVKREALGYRWDGCPNGMDNTPRGRDDYHSIYWVDLIAQQALAADHISQIAAIAGERDSVDEFERLRDGLVVLLNRHYWDEQDGIYYDIKADSLEKVKVKTPASYWPMLAGACNSSQASRLEDHAKDPNIFGGDIPWPSVSRDDPSFTPEGMYWRGAVWLPTAYMASKALDRYGMHETSDELALRLLKHMSRTFLDYEPHTIWECYSPTQPKAATAKDNIEISRPDFCGWSALGPISLFIENVLGFHRIDAVKNVVAWRKHWDCHHGIRRLRFGNVITDIIANGDRVDVTANREYTLEINGTSFPIKTGSQQLALGGNH
jgi:glycogen debranching enzyme